MTRSIKLMLIATTAMLMSGCGPDQSKQEADEAALAAMDSAAADVPMADQSSNASFNEEQMDANENAMMAEKEKDEAAEAEEDAKQDLIDNPVKYVNTGTTSGVYVLRDQRSGCEWIQITGEQNIQIVERPRDDTGKQYCEKTPAK